MTFVDPETTRITSIQVTNGLDFPFTDRHDGVPVTIPPGKSERLPLDMAAHFFGPDLTDRAVMFKYIQKRQGWNTPEFLKQDADGRTLAAQYFGKLKIEPVIYKLVQEERPDPRDPVPADPEIPGSHRGLRRSKAEASA